MATYIVQTKKTEKYQKNYGLPLINIIPAVVWSIPLHQKLFPDANFWMTLLLCGIFVIGYVALSMLPIIAAVPCVASVIMLTAMFWALVDGIGNNFIRILLKVVILAIAVFLELGIFSNAIVPWLQKKEMNRTKIVRVEK